MQLFRARSVGFLVIVLLFGGIFVFAREVHSTTTPEEEPEETQEAPEEIEEEDGPEVPEEPEISGEPEGDGEELGNDGESEEDVGNESDAENEDEEEHLTEDETASTTLEEMLDDTSTTTPLETVDVEDAASSSESTSSTTDVVVHASTTATSTASTTSSVVVSSSSSASQQHSTTTTHDDELDVVIETPEEQAENALLGDRDVRPGEYAFVEAFALIRDAFMPSSPPDRSYRTTSGNAFGLNERGPDNMCVLTPQQITLRSGRSKSITLHIPAPYDRGYEVTLGTPPSGITAQFQNGLTLEVEAHAGAQQGTFSLPISVVANAYGQELETICQLIIVSE